MNVYQPSFLYWLFAWSEDWPLLPRSWRWSWGRIGSVHVLLVAGEELLTHPRQLGKVLPPIWVVREEWLLWRWLCHWGAGLWQFWKPGDVSKGFWGLWEGFYEGNLRGAERVEWMRMHGFNAWAFHADTYWRGFLAAYQDGRKWILKNLSLARGRPITQPTPPDLSVEFWK